MNRHVVSAAVLLILVSTLLSCAGPFGPTETLIDEVVLSGRITYDSPRMSDYQVYYHAFEYSFVADERVRFMTRVWDGLGQEETDGFDGPKFFLFDRDTGEMVEVVKTYWWEYTPEYSYDAHVLLSFEYDGGYGTFYSEGDYVDYELWIDELPYALTDSEAREMVEESLDDIRQDILPAIETGVFTDQVIPGVSGSVTVSGEKTYSVEDWSGYTFWDTVITFTKFRFAEYEDENGCVLSGDIEYSYDLHETSNSHLFPGYCNIDASGGALRVGSPDYKSFVAAFTFSGLGVNADVETLAWSYE